MTDRSFYAYVVGVVACKVAARPSLDEFANGGHFGIWSATKTNEVDVAEAQLERFPVGSAGSSIELRARDIEAPSFTKLGSDFRKRRCAGVGVGFGLARRKGDGGAIGRVRQHDPSEPAAGGLENGAGTRAGHLAECE